MQTIIIRKLFAIIDKENTWVYNGENIIINFAGNDMFLLKLYNLIIWMRVSTTYRK